jgi:hypothetical protein
MLYERLERAINEKADGSELENIINALNIRTGAFGVERKNLINNLFKTIIEMTFPNFVKYLFWGSTENKGLFEDGQLSDLEKRKKLSKYQMEENKNKGGYE